LAFFFSWKGIGACLSKIIHELASERKMAKKVLDSTQYVRYNGPIDQPEDMQHCLKAASSR
jgi:hypothetical protein